MVLNKLDPDSQNAARRAAPKNCVMCEANSNILAYQRPKSRVLHWLCEDCVEKFLRIPDPQEKQRQRRQRVRQAQNEQIKKEIEEQDKRILGEDPDNG